MTDRSRLYPVTDGSVRRSAAPCSRSIGRSGRHLRRRRRVAGMLRFALFLFLIFVAVWAGVRVAHAGDDGAIYSGTPYSVAADDDLWTIAEAQYGGDSDLRAAVYAIRDANDLPTSVLQPGQSLTLPHLDD